MAVDRISFERGSIVVGTKRGKKAARHPIIYWADNGDGSFLGLVLTHSDLGRNIKMQSNHFQEGGILLFDETQPTYVVPCLFMKPANWGPYKEMAKISNKGLQFIEKNINFDEPVYWEDFIRSTS